MRLNYGHVTLIQHVVTCINTNNLQDCTVRPEIMAEAAKPRVLVLGGEHTLLPTARFTNEVGIISPFSSVTFSEASILCCRFLLLFTGVGFIGRNFVKYLVDDGLASKVRCTSAFVTVTTAPV